MTMKHFWQILGVLALALGFSLTATAANPPEKMRLLVPAYFYPAGKGEKDWERLLAAPEEAGVVAIMNPASGPGRRIDPNYTQILEQAKKSNVTLIGYVSTSYGKRKTEDIK